MKNTATPPPKPPEPAISRRTVRPCTSIGSADVDGAMNCFPKVNYARKRTSDRSASAASTQSDHAGRT